MTTAERRKYWEKQVKRWQASGMSMRAWSNEQGLSEKNLSRWKRKLKTEASGLEKEQQTPPGWHEVKRKSPVKPAATGIKLEINECIKIELEQGFDPKLLRDVVEALTKC